MMKIFNLLGIPQGTLKIIQGYPIILLCLLLSLRSMLTWNYITTLLLPLEFPSLYGLFFALVPAEYGETLITFGLLPFVHTSDTRRTMKMVAKLFPTTACMDLVVWDSSNMGITLGVWTKQMPKYLAYMYEMPFYLECILFGIMMSDGFLDKGVNLVRFCFVQSFPAHFPYFWATYMTFLVYCNKGPEFVFKSNGIIKSLVFRTRSLPCFNVFYEMFYPLGKKVVPADIYLFTYLTPLAIAHWVCGDGHWAQTGVLLCTDSFSLSDCCRLVNFLSVRYGWVCTIRGYKKGSPSIYITAQSMENFRKVVGPHMHPSFLYKLGM